MHNPVLYLDLEDENPTVQPKDAGKSMSMIVNNLNLTIVATVKYIKLIIIYINQFIVLGNFNDYVESDTYEYDGAYGGFGWG